jgi:hypothetical protein
LCLCNRHCMADVTYSVRIYTALCPFLLHAIRHPLVNYTALQLHYYFAWNSNLHLPLLLFIGRLNHSGCHQNALSCLNSCWPDWLQHKLYWYDIWPCTVLSGRRRHVAGYYLSCSILLSLFFHLSHTHTGVSSGKVGWDTLQQDRRFCVRFLVGSLEIFHWPNPSTCTL